jgi:NADH-quinone oxidoreductase subunit L
MAYISVPEMPARAAEAFRPIYLLFYNKWYFDELYDRIFVKPAFWIGRLLWKGGDGAIIDGLGPDGLAATTLAAAKRAGRLQTGYVYHYAFAMMIGVVALVSFYLYQMGR